MTEQRTTVGTEAGAVAESARRPYVEPAIAEEELYETCATLSCGLKQARTPGCRGAVNKS